MNFDKFTIAGCLLNFSLQFFRHNECHLANMCDESKGTPTFFLFEVASSKNSLEKDT